MQGFLLIHKPHGPSSAQFLGVLKRTLAIPKSVRVGHGGTLDPFASGLLVVGLSRMYTKLLSHQLLHETKEYEVEIILGKTSDTDDYTGNIHQEEIVAQSINALSVNSRELINKKIIKAIESIQSRTTQIPPQYSAIKLHGTPAYERARKGETFLIKPKMVTLHEYTVHAIEKIDDCIHVRLTMLVSAGFYIRSFARDLGEILGIGGFVQTLKRTKIGDFSLKNALNLSDFDGIMNLYVLVKDGAKNEDFYNTFRADGLMQNTDNLKGYYISGTWNHLQVWLEKIHAYATKNACEIIDWFGK